MKGDRLRVPMENDYALSLGRAIFIFSKLEWSAIECCERIMTDSFHALKFHEKNARILANKLISLAATLPPSLRREVCLAAAEFDRLRKKRNDLLHVQPSTTADGAQRLIRDGLAWKVDMIDEVADDFTECNDRLVALRDKLPSGTVAAP
jgi:hypothetical protein